MTEREPLTYEEVENRMVEQAGRRVAHQYYRYMVTPEDCMSEIRVWLYSAAGQRNVKRWLEHEPQQTSRIRFSMLDKARAYAEREKAQKLGYDVDDVHWYSSTQVAALIPLALDETYDGTLAPEYGDRSRDNGPRAKRDQSELGDVMAMVMDVRSAIAGLDQFVSFNLYQFGPGTADYDAAVEAIVQYLGGPKHYVGRRRVINNQEAQAINSDNN